MSKNNQKFRDEYEKQFEYVGKSPKGEHFAHCTLCNKHFSIRHSGKYDISAHVSTKTHKDLLMIKKNTRDLASFKVPPADKEVIRAECQMVAFIIEHDISQFE